MGSHITGALGAIVGIASLTACGTSDLGRQGCVPLTVPSTIVLLETVPARDTYWQVDDWLLKSALPVGTVLQVESVTQKWGMGGKDKIQVNGRLGDKRQFTYMWGVREHIRRAPWEPLGTDPDRRIRCEM